MWAFLSSTYSSCELYIQFYESKGDSGISLQMLDYNVPGGGQQILICLKNLCSILIGLVTQELLLSNKWNKFSLLRI